MQLGETGIWAGISRQGIPEGEKYGPITDYEVVEICLDKAGVERMINRLLLLQKSGAGTLVVEPCGGEHVLRIVYLREDQQK